MNAALRNVLSRLQGVKRSAAGWMALCPAHDDHTPSLRVDEGDDGRVLLKCWAGCQTEEIVQALDLKMSDLFPTRRIEQPIVAAKRPNKAQKPTYVYKDATGEPLHGVIRTPDKHFWQVRPDGKGGWVYGTEGVGLVLYRLPELIQAVSIGETVFVCEGEKDVDNLTAFGLTATTSAQGAGKWRDHYSGYLAGAKVVVLPDNDEPGRKHAEEVAASLFGIAASVKVLALPGLPDKGDVSDWLHAGNTKERLLELAEQAPEHSTKAEDPKPAALLKDYGHAAVLADTWRGLYRWAVHRGSWMEYTGKVWRPAPDPYVAKKASDTLRRHYAAQIAETCDQERQKELNRSIGDSSIYTRVLGALSFLKGWYGILTIPEEWDRDAWAFNVENGTLDLKTGTLRRHNPEDLLTKLAPVRYEPGAGGLAWTAHLGIFLPNENIRRQVQRSLGVALVGTTLEERLDLWFGSGANGKTTTARALMAITGNYALRAPPDLLIATRNERHPTEIADLAGARLVFSVEVDNGKHLAEALVKDLTGGDRKKARFMREDFFEFEQTFSITLIVNHKPAVVGADEGIWRRIRLIPWTETLSADRRRPQEDVLGELVAEGPAILNWLLDGLKDWQNDRAWIAPEVQAATGDYRAQQDRLGGFLSDRCELGVHFTVAVKDLFDNYGTWAEESGEEPLGKTRFNDCLKQRGFTVKRAAKGVRRWVGLRLGDVG